MIRVLHVVIGMNRGGLETFIMNVYRNINRNVIQFDFLVHTNNECAYDAEIKELGGKIFSVPARNKGVSKNRKALNDFFKNHKEYKIVHQHVSSLTYITPLKYAKRYGVPIRIIHGHSTGQSGHKFHEYIHKYNQHYIKSIATHYFACSEMAAKWLYSKKQFINKKYDIINNAIDSKSFIYCEQKRLEKRSELGLKGQYVIGHIGRFNLVKNHEFLIDIFKSVHEKDNDVILLLVGDGELRINIQEKVNKLGLQNNVIFTGIRSDISDILQAMDIFVFPSLYEGLGIVAVEAQASGLHCIASDQVPKEISVTENVKFLSLDDNVDVWVDEILRKKNYFERQDTSLLVKNNGYDINNVCKKLEKIYINSIEE